MYAPSKRGMGDTATCNWQDDFGNCITPGAGNTIVLQDGTRVKIGSAPAPASTDSFSAFLNANGKYIAIAAAAIVGLSFLKR